MVVVHALYDMCAMPEYIDELRTEAQEALRDNDGSWQLSTLKKLRKLDSFLKESMRFNQPDYRTSPPFCSHPSPKLNPRGLPQETTSSTPPKQVLTPHHLPVGFNRKVLSPLSLSDGTYLPTGLYINVAAEPMSRDPIYYNSPNTFDGYRWYRKNEPLRPQPLEEEFTGVETGNVAWGTGRLTCPGRWYASAMIKLIVAKLLVGYDVRFPEGQSKRPANIYGADAIRPDMTQEIWLRKRG